MALDRGTGRSFGFALSVVALAGLQACAINPLVRWEARSQGPTTADGTLDRGRAFSHSARVAYQQKLDEQVGTSTQLSSGLITLGAIIAALAAGKAHRDAIVGATLLGGTALALGNWNLDKRRLLVYNGAIAAFNCADRAIAPLEMSAADLQDLDARLKDIAGAIATARADVGATELEANKWVAANAAAAPYAAPYYKATAAAQQALTSAEQIYGSGAALKYEASHASDRLIDAVRKIDQEANGALLETLGDLNKVPDVIGSLAGIAGSFAPGSGVQQALSDALKNAVPPPPAPPGQDQGLSARGIPTPPQALRDASVRMAASLRNLDAVANRVLGFVKPRGNVVRSQALADCGVASINFALSAEPPKLSVPTSTAKTLTVMIQGGKAPFAVKPNGTEITGLTVKGPDRLDRSFEVHVPNTVTTAQTATFLIVDSSDPTRTLPYSIDFVGAPAPAPAPARAPAPAASGAKTGKVATNQKPTPSPAASSTLAQLRDAKPFELSGTQLSTADQPLANADGTFTVTLSCKPKPPACLPKDSVRKGFLTAVSADVGAVADKLKFRDIPPGTCVCP